MEKILLPLHLLTLLFITWNVFYADHMGFNWIRGKVLKLDKLTVQKYHYRVWAGLIAMIVTGFFLFWPTHEYFLGRPQFFLKMAFVLTLICNSFAVGYLQEKATTHSFKELSFSEKIPLFISGGLSTISWVGAAITAFFISEY
jgi:hypothetical protein